MKTTENKAFRFTVCDVGGVSKMPIWRRYYENTQGMIIIIIIIADLICMSIIQCNQLIIYKRNKVNCKIWHAYKLLN